jgi:hypothetical protein
VKPLNSFGIRFESSLACFDEAFVRRMGLAFGEGQDDDGRGFSAAAYSIGSQPCFAQAREHMVDVGVFSEPLLEFLSGVSLEIRF